MWGPGYGCVFEMEEMEVLEIGDEGDSETERGKGQLEKVKRNEENVNAQYQSRIRAKGQAVPVKKSN